MRISSIFGLVLATVATVVVADDDNYCEPEYPYGGPPSSGSTPSYGAPYSGYSSGSYGSPSSSGSSSYGPPSSGSGKSYGGGGTPPPGGLNSPDNRQQWGDYDINTDYNFIVPDTGVIREVSQLLQEIDPRVTQLIFRSIG